MKNSFSKKVIRRRMILIVLGILLNAVVGGVPEAAFSFRVRATPSVLIISKSSFQTADSSKLKLMVAVPHIDFRSDTKPNVLVRVENNSRRTIMLDELEGLDFRLIVRNRTAGQLMSGEALWAHFRFPKNKSISDTGIYSSMIDLSSLTWSELSQVSENKPKAILFRGIPGGDYFLTVDLRIKENTSLAKEEKGNTLKSRPTLVKL